jgi:hypothetical protein
LLLSLNLSRMANGAYHAALCRGGKEGSAFCFDGLRLCLVNILLMKPLYSRIRDRFWPGACMILTEGALCDRPLHYQKHSGSRDYRHGAVDPGLALAQPVRQLPAPFSSPTAALVMIFAGSC